MRRASDERLALFGQADQGCPAVRRVRAPRGQPGRLQGFRVGQHDGPRPGPRRLGRARPLAHTARLPTPAAPDRLAIGDG